MAEELVQLHTVSTKASLVVDVQEWGREKEGEGVRRRMGRGGERLLLLLLKAGLEARARDTVPITYSVYSPCLKPPLKVSSLVTGVCATSRQHRATRPAPFAHGRAAGAAKKQQQKFFY
jgi:hypothetical protein